ncbi:hypothetical protein K1T71_012393 [Dendrolimus kikuchii]|uniref:Uncharacterized protein n=1 Tax=Dendrolimus kikuchii TaxID=765133 RepID=A0ACC1CLP2_9NEOP|nr:hypothetical protein K1T71_012393 [Dendrolimus kikuchii]
MRETMFVKEASEIAARPGRAAAETVYQKAWMPNMARISGFAGGARAASLAHHQATAKILFPSKKHIRATRAQRTAELRARRPPTSLIRQCFECRRGGATPAHRAHVVRASQCTPAPRS